MRSLLSISVWISNGCLNSEAESASVSGRNELEEVDHEPGIMKSAGSIASSRPINISRWMLLVRRAGICGFWRNTSINDSQS